MKKFPTEYSKEELLADINYSFEKLSNNELLNTGTKNNLISRIQIAQLQLTSLQNKETTEKLNTILDTNNSSSRNTVILSVLMIILAVITILQAMLKSEIDYTQFNKSQIEELNAIKQGNINRNKILDSLHIRIDKISNNLENNSE